LTRIDFYSLQEGSRGDRFLLSCRLAERIYQEGKRLYIHVPDAAEREHLDRLLWTYRDRSFLPHGLAGQADPDLTPILLGEGTHLPEAPQVLINLDREIPEFFSSFQRLCEPIDLDPEIRQAGRERYRRYGQQGYERFHHALLL